MLKRISLLIIVVGIGLMVGLAAFTAIVVLSPSTWAFAQAPARTAASTPVPVSATLPAPASLAGFDAALEQIYNQVNPSVVTIRVVQKQAVQFPTIPEIPNFPFFGFPQNQQPQYQYQQALGSGFVWDTSGDIVTNNHVVAGANQISVTFADGTVVPGKVVGSDPDSDLAVIRVNAPASELHPVQLADSTQLKVGQLAIAIGNPFGEHNTMTTGIVSALGRSLPVNGNSTSSASYTIPDVIQTDAPINPGNSGGVLLNDQGQVIGVTSAIESPVRASSGIGFAIPSAIVQKVVPALIQTGHYAHPWIGISGTSLDPTLAQAMRLNADQRGALVVDVTPGSPADKAGVRGSTRQTTIDGQSVRVGGDVITALDGQPVQSFDDLVAMLARSTEVNQTITLTILRDGKSQSIQVTLAARPSTSAQTSQPSQSAATAPWLGVQDTTLTAQIARAMNLSSNQQGVLVEQVESGSPADKAGLQGSYKTTVIGGKTVRIGGDVIVAVDGQSIASAAELQSAIARYNVGDAVTLTVLRDGNQMNIRVTLASRPSQTS